MARTATISPNPASRGWRGRCAPRSRSIRAMPAKCRPPRVSSAADPPAHRRRSAMPVYTVHAPRSAESAADSLVPGGTDRFVFVRDGFHFWAFLLAPLWLLRHRLWLALLGYVAVMTVVMVALSRLEV